MLIKLTDAITVAANDVAELEVNAHGNGVHVRTFGGRSHYVPNDYAQSSYATKDRLTKEVNAALEKANG